MSVSIGSYQRILTQVITLCLITGERIVGNTTFCQGRHWLSSHHWTLNISVSATRMYEVTVVVLVAVVVVVVVVLLSLPDPIF